MEEEGDSHPSFPTFKTTTSSTLRTLTIFFLCLQANGSSATSSSSIGRPPSSNGAGPSSIISALGSGSKKRLPENPAAASSYATGSGGTGDGWQTVGAVHPNKFQMKKSPQKKFIEVGTTVICIHTKVRICFYFSSF